MIDIEEMSPNAREARRHTDRGAVLSIHAEVWSRTQAMLDDLVAAWGSASRRAA